MIDPDLSSEIGALADLDLSALRQRWLELYCSTAPARMSRQLFVQAIAYRLQEKAIGGLPRALRMRLDNGETYNGGTAKGNRARLSVQRRVKPGTQFLREWQGRTHKVTATDDGRFLYRGKVYRSLSTIARTITGTRWSGPAFFGLNQNTEPRRHG